MTPIPTIHDPLAPLWPLLFPAPADETANPLNVGCSDKEVDQTGAGSFPSTELNNNKPNETKPQ